MKLIYVAGPFSAPTRDGVERNIICAADLGVEICKLGGYPLVPHSNTADPRYEHAQPYQFWIAATMAMLRVCDAVALVRRWEQSSGARGEVAAADRLGLPVFYPGDGQLPEIQRWLEAHRAERGVAETLRPSPDDPFSTAAIRRELETLTEER